MGKSFNDPILDTVAGIASVVGDLFLDKDPRDLIDLIGVEDNSTLVVSNLGLMSLIEIKGIYGSVGTDEFHSAIMAVNEGLNLRMKEKSGFLVKVMYASDPDAARFVLEENFKASRAHIDACKLELHDLIDEKIEVNIPYVQREEIFLAFYTKSSAVNTKTTAEKLDTVGDGLTQTLISSEALKNAHKSTFNSIISSINRIFKVDVVSSDMILKGIYAAINGDAAAKKASFAKFFPTEHDQNSREAMRHLPNLKVKLDKFKFTDAFRRITYENNKSLEPLSPIRLGDQLVASACFDTGNKFVVSGNRIYAPVAAYKYGMDLKDFDHLINSLKRIPFRIAITIAPDGLNQGFVDGLLLMLISVVNEKNRLKDRALRALRSRQATEPIVSVSITAATWSNIDRKIDADTGKTFYSTVEIERRLVSLTTAINDWASIQVKPCAGDLVECLYSTIPGLIGYHCVDTVAAPLVDIIQILPITRPCAVWEYGSSLWRTDDGKIIPYSQMSSLQSSDVILIAGPMGFGKSGQISALNLSFITEPSATAQLPILRGIDFGNSQSGVQSAIAASLPPHERHKAKYELIKNERGYCYNVHDLPLGSRYPTPEHKDFLIYYLVSLTDSISEFPNHSGMCEAAIALAYKRFLDKDANPNAKRYTRNLHQDLDAYILQQGLDVVEGETTMFALTDLLFGLGESRLASIAQRFAVPTIGDYANIVAESEFIQEYGDKFNGQEISKQFSRAIRETLRQIPMINDYTQFDVSESPIFIVDLKDVIPKGEQPRSGQAKSALIYLTMMRALTADFFADESDLKYFNPAYREYHLNRINLLKPSKKRMFIDEKHRINKIPAASAALDQMVFEGRKYKISILQGSQLINHFSLEIVKLATSVIICGSNSPSEIKEIARTYGLSDFHCDLISNIKQPSKKGSEFFVRFQTSEKAISLKLLNTEGPIHLCLIATEAEDRSVRDGLYKLSRSIIKARKAYSIEFPSGRVKDEIEKRKKLNSEGVYNSRYGDFIKDIIADIVERYDLTN